MTKNRARRTAEHRERAIGLVQLAAYAFWGIRYYAKTTVGKLITGWLEELQIGHKVEDPAALHLHNTFLTVTSSALTAPDRVINRHLKRHRLWENAIRTCQPFKGMTLTRQHQLWRLRSTRQVQRLPCRRWRHVLLFDESRLKLTGEHRSLDMCSGDYRLVVEEWWFGLGYVAERGHNCCHWWKC